MKAILIVAVRVAQIGTSCVVGALFRACRGERVPRFRSLVPLPDNGVIGDVLVADLC